MNNDRYYKYWALVALRDRDLGRSWGKSAYKESMHSLTLQRMK